MESGFYMIETGKVRLIKKGKVLDTISDGAYFSDYSAADGGECVTSATAEEESIIHCLGRKKFVSIMQEYPNIGIKLYEKSLKSAMMRLRKLE